LYKKKKIKVMKITSKTLMVNFETEVKLGNNDAIELTLEHNAFISESKSGDINFEIDPGVDVKNIKFLGIPIKEGFNEYREFKKSLLDLGIDLEKLIDEKEKELIDNGLEDKLRLMIKTESLK
jgi:hypothetical protein